MLLYIMEICVYLHSEKKTAWGYIPLVSLLCRSIFKHEESCTQDTLLPFPLPDIVEVLTWEFIQGPEHRDVLYMILNKTILL